MTDAAAPAAAPAAAAPAAPLTEADRQAAAKAVAQAHREAAAAAGAGDKPAAPVAPAPVVHERPEGVPEKFFNKETGVVDYKAWGAAHSSLETQFHQQKTEPPAKTPEQLAAEAAAEAAKTPEQKAAEAAEKAAAAPAEARKAAIAAAQTEFAQTGQLSAARYAELEAQGYDRAMVDGYIAGQTAKVEAVRQAAFSGAESEANYTAMLAWAEKNLTDAEIAAYDVQINTNDPKIIKAASAALYARYKTVAPVEGQRVAGGAPAPGASMFNSKAEMTAAMSEPSPTQRGKTRYETDAAFRADVQRKISAARKAGVNIFI